MLYARSSRIGHRLRVGNVIRHTVIARCHSTPSNEMFGDGVTQDEVMARHWFEKAAAQGNAAAKFKLGVLSTPSLKSVPRDFTEALEWYKKAAAHGGVNAYRRWRHD